MPSKDGSWDVTLGAEDCGDPRPHDGHDWVNEYDNAFHCIGTADKEDL